MLGYTMRKWGEITCLYLCGTLQYMLWAHRNTRQGTRGISHSGSSSDSHFGQTLPSPRFGFPHLWSDRLLLTKVHLYYWGANIPTFLQPVYVELESSLPLLQEEWIFFPCLSITEPHKSSFLEEICRLDYWEIDMPVKFRPDILDTFLWPWQNTMAKTTKLRAYILSAGREANWECHRIWNCKSSPQLQKFSSKPLF